MNSNEGNIMALSSGEGDSSGGNDVTPASLTNTGYCCEKLMVYLWFIYFATVC